MSQRVAILGPGAVGGVLTVGLVQAGVPVICIARPHTAELIRAKGLSLRQGQNMQTVRPEVRPEVGLPAGPGSLSSSNLARAQRDSPEVRLHI